MLSQDTGVLLLSSASSIALGWLLAASTMSCRQFPLLKRRGNSLCLWQGWLVLQLRFSRLLQQDFVQAVLGLWCLLLQIVAFPFKISNLPLNVGGQGVQNWWSKIALKMVARRSSACCFSHHIFYVCCLTRIMRVDLIIHIWHILFFTALLCDAPRWGLHKM